jgi:hypothetical protein
MLGDLTDACPPPFVFRRRTIAECRVASRGVVEPFDEVEQRRACRPMRRKRASVEQFAFERGEETLHQRVIVAIASAPA